MTSARRRTASRSPSRRPATTAVESAGVPAMLGAKPAAAPASWRYNTVAGGFFAACAYIQVNDPDPLVRLLGYFVGGTCWSVASLLFPRFMSRCAPAVMCLWIFLSGLLTGLALPSVHCSEPAAGSSAAAHLVACVPDFVHVQTAREAIGALLLSVHTVCAPRSVLRFREKALFVAFALGIAFWVFQPDPAVRAPPAAFAAA